MLVIGVAALLIVPLASQPNAWFVNAQSTTVDTNNTFTIPENLDLEQLAKFTVSDKQRASEIFLNNAQVQRIIAEKPFEIEAIGVGTPDLSAKPPKFHITFNISMEDRVLAGSVDLQSEKVVNIIESPVTVLGHSRAFATAFNTGSPTTWDGIRGKLNAPIFNPSGSSNDDATAFLVNGMMSGSANGSLCGDANFPSNYWLQGGIRFHPLLPDGDIVWADTTSGTGTAGCIAQPMSSVPFADLASYRVDVFTSTADSAWKVTIVKLTSPLAAQTITRTGMSTFTVDAASNWATSVWFEDTTHTDLASTWDNQFRDAQFNPSNPSGQSWRSPPNDSNWYTWSPEQQEIHSCAGVNSDKPPPDEVISGSLASGGTATWLLPNFADKYDSNC